MQLLKLTYNYFSHLLAKFIDLLYPSTCMTCNEFVIGNQAICNKCWLDIKFTAPPFCYICSKLFSYTIIGDEHLLCGKCIKAKPAYDLARRLFTFDSSSRKIIHRFKYYDQTHIIKLLVKLLYYRYHQLTEQYDLIIPVPMHWFKRIMRMYNQAALIAQHYSSLSKIDINYNILLKNKWTSPQTSLKQAARKKNLQNSFQVNDAHIVAGKNIILIDDVLTTGTTVTECTKLLKKNGANRVLVLTLAAT